MIMKRIACGLSMLAVAAVAGAADLTIKDVMGKAHKGAGALLPTLGKGLRSDSPSWEEIQKQTKELVELGEALGKNDPPKGAKPSWEKFTKNYVQLAKDLQSAAEKKNTQDARSAHAKLVGSCKACHNAHKG